MPKAHYYEGLTLADALRAFADHHGAPRTRHITADETTLLYRAADRLEQVTTVPASDTATDGDLARITPLLRRAASQ